MPRLTTHTNRSHSHKLFKHRLRRQPQQQRGQQRVDAILDAAETAFAEVGYEAATTNQIAANAGISIGSIYQFFTNKEAILQAVSARYAEGFFAAFQSYTQDANAQHLSIEAIVNLLIDGLFDFGVRHLGFVKIALHAGEGTLLGALTQKFQQALVARIAPVMGQFAAQLGAQISEEDCLFHARLAHSAIKGHVAWAISEVHAGRKASAQRILHHAKRMQVAYFEKVLADALH
jgi:AcrR family transcriptional regulator